MLRWDEIDVVPLRLQVITIKDEPVDLDFYEDNIEIISETTLDSDLVSNLTLNLKCKELGYTVTALYSTFRNQRLLSIV